MARDDPGRYMQTPQPMEADVTKTGKDTSPFSKESTIQGTQLGPPDMDAVVSIETIQPVNKDLNASAVGKTGRPKNLIDVNDPIPYFDAGRQKT